MAQQQYFLVVGLESNTTGEHAPLRVAIGAKPGLIQAEQGKIVGQLSVNKPGGIFAFNANNAQRVDAHDTIETCVCGGLGGFIRGKTGVHVSIMIPPFDFPESYAVRRLFYSLLGLILVLAALASGAVYVWVHHAMALQSPTVDLSIDPGQSPREVANEVVRSGIMVNPSGLYWWFRLSGEARKIKAGSYELDANTTPAVLLNKLVRGEETLESVTLIEGWNLRQVREALRNASHLVDKSQGLSAPELMDALGRNGQLAEGHFFPDTYTYARGSTDLALLQRAARAMDRRLANAWAQRSPQSVLQTPQEALTLASIVEKETGRASDRNMIAAVFHNRLRLGMRLQTDPTVIYGMGERFDGNLHKVDLQTDTPWNTYTRAGLPPTPIAMPGRAALLAAVQPAQSNALYFVARGDGSSQFSETLSAHNTAVNKYQRGL